MKCIRLNRKLMRKSCKMLLRALIFFIFAKFVFSRYFIVGPAQITLDNIAPCPEYNDLPIKFTLKTRMYNKTTQVYNGFLYFPGDIDDNVTVYMKASRVDKQKTQVNSFTLYGAEACSTLNKYLGDLWIDIQSQLGVEPGVCPIKMGNYTVKDLYLDLSKMNVQMLLQGQFKTRFMMKNNTKVIYCDDYTVTLAPKEG